jgi:hypothetical protein
VDFGGASTVGSIHANVDARVLSGATGGPGGAKTAGELEHARMWRIRTSEMLGRRF